MVYKEFSPKMIPVMYFMGKKDIHAKPESATASEMLSTPTKFIGRIFEEDGEEFNIAGVQKCDERLGGLQYLVQVSTLQGASFTCSPQSIFDFI